MASVGETLRRERIRRNLDLEQISRETKISSRFLDAIETEHFEKLPGGVFARSFVRQYARVLELDEEELVSSLDHLLEPAVPLPEAKTRREPTVDAHIPLPKVEEWESGRAGEGRFKLSSSLPALAGVVLVMLACSLVYAWWQRTRQTPVTEQSPAVTATNTSPPAPVSTPPVTPSDQPADSASAPPTAERMAPEASQPQPAAPKPSIPAAPANPNAGVRVQLTAQEPTWMLVRTDGKFLFAGTLDVNETRNVEATGTVLVRLGNAGGVSISYNGKPIGAAGPRGQVRTLQFTSGGFQAVPAAPAAPKPEAALDPL